MVDAFFLVMFNKVPHLSAHMVYIVNQIVDIEIIVLLQLLYIVRITLPMFVYEKYSTWGCVAAFNFILCCISLLTHTLMLYFLYTYMVEF